MAELTTGAGRGDPLALMKAQREPRDLERARFEQVSLAATRQQIKMIDVARRDASQQEDEEDSGSQTHGSLQVAYW